MRQRMTPDRWALTLAGLLGQPWPALPALPGRLFECHDEPMTPDELAAITDPIELARCAGITRQAAHQRLQQRAATAQKDPT